MMLVLNCGSQSVKYKVFDGDLGLVKEKKITVNDRRDYRKVLIDELGQVKKLGGRIDAVGHRVVHGGERFRKPTAVTLAVLRELKKYEAWAPLHNPFNVLGIEISSAVFPKTKQIAVFDTGFYEDLPEQAFIYPLPEEIRRRYVFRKFGFHGISHEYAARTAAQKLGKDFNKTKIIVCHLGGGSSVTAIKNGRAVDTSMGFTPLEGVAMMTRAGDLDPGVVLEIAKTLSPEKASEILNYESGLKGICGVDKMTEVLKKAGQGDAKAALALKIFAYRIQKYIGAYFAVLGGCDLLVFTGAIGAGSGKIRRMICSGLALLRKPDNVKILAVEPDEELAIAQKIKKHEF